MVLVLLNGKVVPTFCLLWCKKNSKEDIDNLPFLGKNQISTFSPGPVLEKRQIRTFFTRTFCIRAFSTRDLSYSGASVAGPFEAGPFVDGRFEARRFVGVPIIHVELKHAHAFFLWS